MLIPWLPYSYVRIRARGIIANKITKEVYNMIRISKKAGEKLKGTPEDTKKDFRVFVSGIG
jgi:hypothetical protein